MKARERGETLEKGGECMKVLLGSGFSVSNRVERATGTA